MYLVDTNIWLEVLLDQEKSTSAYRFLKETDVTMLHLSDFSLYSIGIILIKLQKSDILKKFVNDISDAGIKIIRLDIRDFDEIIKVAQKYKLDFDDAYQYTLARKYNLKIVSFDEDFDRTDIERMKLI